MERALASKASIANGLHIRLGLDEREAAVFVGVSPTYFRTLVANRVMPRPRVMGRRRVWDVEELTRSFRDLPHEGEDGELDDGWEDYR